MASEARIISAASVIWARVSPVAVSTTSQSTARTCSAHSSKPAVWRSTNSWSIASHSSMQRADGLEQREVAVEPDRQVQVGDVGALADDSARLLRVAEVDQPGLAQRVDRDDLGAAPLGDLERRQHPRVVGAGVLAGDHDALGVVDVAQADAALADADRLRQRRAARLVAHVGAVGQVVGAVGADEQLVEERGLVGGPARRVEDRLVGAGERVEMVADQPQRLFPADLLVVRPAGSLDHGVRDAALLAEPVLVVSRQVGDAVTREELRGRPVLGRLLGDGLGAVLAELSGVPVLGVRVGPRAAHAVEAVRLVELEQRLGGVLDPHVGHRALQRHAYAGHARGSALGVVDLELALVDHVVRHVSPPWSFVPHMAYPHDATVNA